MFELCVYKGGVYTYITVAVQWNMHVQYGMHIS